MKKKDLFEQNNELFDKLQKSLVINKRLESELTNKDDMLLKLQQQIDELSKRVEELSHAAENTFTVDYGVKTSDAQLDERKTSPESVSEPDVMAEEIKFSDEIEYGAKIIGKIVVESAKATELVANNKELVNLILFKTESIKAEILNICNSEVSFDDKKSMIDFQLQEATDYYKSILAQ